MTIPPRFLSELRDRLTLSEIIGRRVKVTRAGREFKACCPFHSEKSPSFTINDEKQFYHCFGCGAHGDVIGFVMQHDNLSFADAVEGLAAEAGMQVPRQTPQDVEKAKVQKDLYALLDETARWFEAQLYDRRNGAALQYMRDRGAADALLSAFRIGFAPADGRALWRHLKEAGYSEPQMIEAGVVRRSARDGSFYAFFRERIIFPVADRRGRVVAFGGRILPDHLRPPDIGGAKPPKYINSGDSELFHKGRMLYGESRARQAAADGQPLIVVEGYMDVMACFSAGFSGAVAPLGTALTEEQIVILWKMIPDRVKNPVLCFDGDEAGRRAAARACERILPLLQPDQSALFAFLPDGQDPDSLIRSQGKDGFAKVIENAIPMADFIWSHHTAGRRFDTPESRAGLSKSLEDEALRIADRSVQHFYRQIFRDRLYGSFGKGGAGRKGKGKKSAETAGIPVGRPVFSGESLYGRIALAALINHPDLFDSVEEELGHLDMANEGLDLLRQTVLNILGTREGIDSGALRTYLEERGFSSELEAVLSESVYTHAGFARPGADGHAVAEGWKDVFSRMRRRAVGQELREAGRALARDFSTDNEDRIMALHDVHKAGGE